MAIVAGGAVLAMALTGAADATLPGRDGRIAFDALPHCADRDAVALIRPGQRQPRFVGGSGCTAGLISTATPQWTAGGSRLLVLYARGGLIAGDAFARYATLRPDGSGLRETPWRDWWPGLFPPATPLRWPRNVIDDADLSPDGRRLAYTRPGRLHPVIWTADRDGGGARRTAHGACATACIRVGRPTA